MALVALLVCSAGSAGAAPGSSSNAEPEIAPLTMPAPPSDLPEASAAPNRQAARRLFSMAVDLVREGRYAAAKALFLEAYAAEPHYVVLYNIAQAELKLGERTLAIDHLRAFLDQGGVTIDARQRQSTEDDIQRAEAELRAQSNLDGTEIHSSSTLQTRADTPPAASAEFGTSAQLSAAPVLPLVSPARTATLEKAAPPAWTYGLIAGGFAVVGGAVGLYFWNDGRYQRWHEEDSALRSRKAELTGRGVLPTEDPELVARATENDTLLHSIERFDAIPLVVGGVGVAAMGLGLWALIDFRDEGTWSLSLSASEIRAQARF